MDSGKQANFFNSVADITSNYDTELCFQLQHITDEDILSERDINPNSKIGSWWDGKSRRD